jgi:hypothetical protein
MNGIRTNNSIVVIGTDYIGSCNSNLHTTTTLMHIIFSSMHLKTIHNSEGGMGGTTREGWVGPPRQQLLTVTGNIYRIGNIGKKNLVFYSNFNVPTHFQNLQ